jgi:hypothetical protein
MDAGILGSGKWCPETESNRRHTPFQGVALPTELSGRTTRMFFKNAFRSIRPVRKRKFLFPALMGNFCKKPFSAQQKQPKKRAVVILKA